MDFKEYKNAEHWTEKFMIEQGGEPKEITPFMSVSAFVGVIVTTFALFGLLFVACSLDSLV